MPLLVWHEAALRQRREGWAAVVDTDAASSAHPPFTSSCVAQFLTGHRPVLGTPDFIHWGPQQRDWGRTSVLSLKEKTHLLLRHYPWDSYWDIHHRLSWFVGFGCGLEIHRWFPELPACRQPICLHNHANQSLIINVLSTYPQRKNNLLWKKITSLWALNDPCKLLLTMSSSVKKRFLGTALWCSG